MVRVTCDKPINTVVAGAQFKDGVAETDNVGALAYFRRNPRFTVEAPRSAPRRRRKSKDEEGDE